MDIQKSVVTEVQNGIGWIKLNRPRALNSLNVDMVDTMNEQLKKWKLDDSVSFVCIYGEGEKGLCAGGDMRALYDLKEDDIEAYAKQFFSIEYELDYEIHHYPKPVVVFMNGIVMGGGVGLSIGASHRIVTESSKWAMPEMNIGFFPDVGASYFLNQMPGSVGRYLALTATVIHAQDALYIGAADHFIESKDWPKLKEGMMEKRWTPDSVETDLNQLLDSFRRPVSLPSSISSVQDKIDQYFRFETIEEIISSLKQGARTGDEWAEKTIETLRSMSPTSLKVTLRQMQKGKEQSLQACFDMEQNLALHFMKCHDFYEGVRSVLVDKDRTPKWNPSTLSEVTERQVDSFFETV
ncbi:MULTISPECIES: enoyl-CoA hydratase/isomerase family protein [unclassified Exiguobacterium]|uniref:enoyl-CoA hydratase/isomerase family protein n=1 Tax=unclassified Exiguobacterium TaxID=2644629 RepID=UPI001BE73B69|nr:MULTISPECIES: enoyl-CoA hydratase/isomerase family protein [unclassified Exiguobacterium]